MKLEKPSIYPRRPRLRRNTSRGSAQWLPASILSADHEAEGLAAD
jgi:hypothetical protein